VGSWAHGMGVGSVGARWLDRGMDQLDQACAWFYWRVHLARSTDPGDEPIGTSPRVINSIYIYIIFNFYLAPSSLSFEISHTYVDTPTYFKHTT
jgi:hypothetical protein